MPVQVAIEGLHKTLIELGESGSNPVLAVLPRPDSFMQGVKYPPGKLRFSGLGLRAYYHNHALPYVRENEHGHFHIFISSEPSPQRQDWQHLAALSVDAMGQPRSWFCVNNWVTGGKWLTVEEAVSGLAGLFQYPASQLSAVERWLFYMLAVYAPSLQDLLQRRDEMLDSLCAGAHQALFDDRSVYDLAELPVDLLADLATLLGEQNLNSN